MNTDYSQYYLKLNNTEELDKIIALLKEHKIPKEYPEFINNFRFRESICKLQGFCLVSQTWIDNLADWIGNRKVLEVMAGCGVISYSLLQKAVDIKPTDDFSWPDSDSSWTNDKTYWTDIENIDAIEAVKKYGKDIDIIIMSWPYMDDTAYRVLLEMRKQNPECLMIYIGESECGCTADDAFFECMEKSTDPSFSKVIDSHQRWDGMHDFPYLLK